MSEENNSSSVERSEPTRSSDSLTVKDLLVPVSIIVAGLFVGVGLYFGGASPASNMVIGNQAGGQQNPTGNVQAPQLSLVDLVESAGVDADAFQECVESGETVAIVDGHMQNAFETGGRGTPWSILIGPGGKKYPINGALPQANIEQLIELAKSEAGQGPSTAEEDAALNMVAPLSDSDHIKGNQNADIVIIEYSDYDCPFCARFHATMNTISAKYADDVAWVYRHLPLEQLHPNAKNIAIASECVAKIGGNEAFWEFTDGYLSS